MQRVRVGLGRGGGEEGLLQGLDLGLLLLLVLLDERLGRGRGASEQGQADGAQDEAQEREGLGQPRHGGVGRLKPRGVGSGRSVGVACLCLLAGVARWCQSMFGLGIGRVLRVPVACMVRSCAGAGEGTQLAHTTATDCCRTRFRVESD